MSDETTTDQTTDNQPEKELEPDGTFRNTPVFDVSKDEFFNNMRRDRNRMRFANKSKISKFMQTNNYRKPVFMRYTDPNGQQYVSKIK